MRWIMSFCAAALTIGCNQSGGPVVAVHGIVTLDSQPVDGAIITFYPEDKSAGVKDGGTTRTGTDGKFVVKGFKGQPGLAPGQYKVTVSKLVEQEEEIEAAITDVDLKHDFPPHYSQLEKSVLVYTVTGDGAPIKIELSSKRKR